MTCSLLGNVNFTVEKSPRLRFSCLIDFVTLISVKQLARVCASHCQPTRAVIDRVVKIVQSRVSQLIVTDSTSMFASVLNYAIGISLFIAI